MAKQIIWTKQALGKLHEMILYLQDEVSLRAAINLNKMISEKLELIEQFPEAGRKSKKKKTARFVLIGKHRRMFIEYMAAKSLLYIFSTPASIQIKANIETTYQNGQLTSPDF